MGLKLSSDVQLVFFQKLFGSTHAATLLAQKVLAGGVKFDVSLYDVSASLGSKALGTVTLTYGTTALIKGLGGAAVVAQNKKLVEDWLNQLPVFPVTEPAQPVAVSVPVYLKGVLPGAPQPNFIALIKAIRTVTGLSLSEAKQKAEMVLGGTDVLMVVCTSMQVAQQTAANLNAVGGATSFEVGKPSAFTVASSPKPVDEVMDLQKVEAIGQKVHGSSKGSVYYAVAIGQHVKVAARLDKVGSVSLRAEWTGHPPQSELEKLKDAGMSVKGHYASVHFSAGDVPLSRVVGAFLMGTGIPWTAITNGAELVIQ